MDDTVFLSPKSFSFFISFFFRIHTNSNRECVCLFNFPNMSSLSFSLTLTTRDTRAESSRSKSTVFGGHVSQLACSTVDTEPDRASSTLFACLLYHGPDKKRERERCSKSVSLFSMFVIQMCKRMCKLIRKSSTYTY